MTVQQITQETLDIAALRKGQGHKYDYGHALVLAGGPGRTGAARLAARGALRIGAGAVSLGVSPGAQMEVAGHITAIMLRRIVDSDALSTLLQDRRINAVCIGPGLGMGVRSTALLKTVLACRVSTVLDADALTLVSQDKALFTALHDRCVLTPHGGEFERIFPDLAKCMAADPSYSKTTATRDAAAQAGCTVVFKGKETVIATADGHCAVHSATGARAVPWLATAGAGDVLAGFILGLLTRGIAPQKATALAVWLHVECACQFGPGLIAEDLPDELPQVMRQVGV